MTTAISSPSAAGATTPQWTPIQHQSAYRQYGPHSEEQQLLHSPPSYIHQSFRPIYSGGIASASPLPHSSTPGPYPQSLSAAHHAPLHPAAASSSPAPSNKRTASRAALGGGNGDSSSGGGSAAKKEKKLKGKWTEEEEKLLIKLRSSGMKWGDISQQNPGRSATACRLRYQNYTEKKEWAEDEKDMLARLYHRFMEDMWKRIADEMCRPWRSCERMHWQLGEEEMLRRANVQYRSASDNPNATPPGPGSTTSTSAGMGGAGDTSPASSIHHSVDDNYAASPHQRAHHHHTRFPDHHSHPLSREPSRERDAQHWAPPSVAVPTIQPPPPPHSTGRSSGHPSPHPTPQHAPPPPLLTLHQPLPSSAALHAFGSTTTPLGTPRQTPTPLSSAPSVGQSSSAGHHAPPTHHHQQHHHQVRPITPLSQSLGAGAHSGSSGGSGSVSRSESIGGGDLVTTAPTSQATTPRTVPTVVHASSNGGGAGGLGSPFASTNGGGSPTATTTTTTTTTTSPARRLRSAGFVADMEVVKREVDRDD